MRRKWIIVADRAGARLFRFDDRERALEQLRDIDHDDGRLRNREIDADRQGIANQSQGTGQGAMAREHDATEQLAVRFAGELAELLREGRVENAYDELVLVAPPAFLGALREALDGPTRDRVVASLDKDLAQVPEHELRARLSDVLFQH